MESGVRLLYSPVWFVKNANFHGFDELFNNLIVVWDGPSVRCLSPLGDRLAAERMGSYVDDM